MSEDNTAPIHHGCAKSRHEQMQEMIADVPLTEFVGKFVKLPFEANGHTEHMWVQVTGLAEHEDEELRGELNNTPALITDYALGDIVEFKKADIEEVYVK